jgi:GxxExxY protein
MELNDITGQIVDAAMKVHSALGPGLLESVYEKCLLYELHRRGIEACCQVGLPIKYGDVRIDSGLIIDMLVRDQVVVEVKAVDELNPIHEAQLMSYLRLSDKRVGLLINFNVVHLRDGIKRFANKL